MKIAIKDTEYVVSLVAMKAIVSSTLSLGDKMLCDKILYVYYTGALNGVKPDDLSATVLGRWVKKDVYKSVLSIVDDGYDFTSNSSTDLCDTDSNAIDAFKNFGERLLGTAFGFNDWMCLRDQIKIHVQNIAGSDYSTFSSLSTGQKKIALIYCCTKIFKSQGAVFFATECATAGIDPGYTLRTYISMASVARENRYYELIVYAYQQLEPGDGLKAEDAVRSGNLKSKFEERGVVHTAEDGVDGLDDWIQSDGSFPTTGLLAKLNDSTYSLIDTELTNQQFCNNCSGIVNEGKY